MRRVVFLHDEIGFFGGGERLLLEVGETARRSADIDLGLLWEKRHPDLASRAGAVFDELRSFGYPPSAPRPRTSSDYKDATRRLHDWLTERNPRVVFAFALRAALYAVTWARRRGVPLVWVCQQNFPLYPSRWGGVKQFAVLRYLARANPWIVTLNEEGTRAIGRTGFPPSRTVCIRNGVDTARFEQARMTDEEKQSWRRKRNIPGGDLVVVCLARLDPCKGQGTVLEAVHSARWSGVKVIPVFVGGAESPAHADSLRRLSVQLGIDDQVVWAGEQADVRPWLTMADAAVLASLRECASLALLEAGACGLPVVASNAGGTPEVVRHRETGLTFEPGDGAGLAAALLELSARPERRVELGEAMQRLVRRDFDWERCSAAWTELFDRFLESAPDR